MSGVLKHGPTSYRFRATRAGATVLVDESVSLFQQDPLRWLLAGWRPVLPLTVVGLVFVRFHRVEWLDQQWGATQQLSSIGLSLLVVCAWLLRSVGQGKVCCAVLEQTHPRALAHLRASAAPLRPIEQGWNLALLALLTTGLGLLGGLLGGIPGLAAVSFLAPMTGIVVFEGRRLPDALVRRLQLPLGVFMRGAMAVALTQFLVFLTWVNLIAGAQLLVLLLRMGTGLDVAVLERMVSPSDPGFLLCSLGLAFLLVEPIWAIQRALIYLDAHLSQSGIDLLERWEELAPGDGDGSAPKCSPQSPGWSKRTQLQALSVVLVALGSLASAAPLQAEDGGLDDEREVAGEIYVSVNDFARRLETLADMFEEQLDLYDEEGSAPPGVLRGLISERTESLVRFSDGSVVPFHLLALKEVVPEILHTDRQRRQLQSLVERLRASAELLRQVDQEPVAQRSSSDDPSSPAEHLRAELSESGYLLAPNEGVGRLYREGLRERISRWFRNLLDSLDPPPDPGRAEPGRPPRISPTVAGVLLALVVVVLVAVWWRRLRLVKSHRPALPARAGSQRPALGVDARSRSPLSWREQARGLAAAGRHSEAVRSLFLATLARLDRNREIDYRPDHTNGEHLRSFGGVPERRRRFVAATQRFEGHWYGISECGQRDFEVMEELCEPLVMGGPSPRLDDSGTNSSAQRGEHGR